MYYGVKSYEDTYIIVESTKADDLFINYGCEAVFDLLENAEAYKEWLE
jgi:hypothetical protein